MAVKLKCSACRGSFRWNTEEPWPNFCPLCSVAMGNDRADDDIVMPFVRSSANTKTHDKLYREMEKASERRMEDVASMTGSPTSELSHLKITDLRSTKEPGSIAAPPLPAHLQNVGGFQGTGNEWAGAIKTGPEPNAGARTMARLSRITGRG